MDPDVDKAPSIVVVIVMGVGDVARLLLLLPLWLDDFWKKDAVSVVCCGMVEMTVCIYHKPKCVMVVVVVVAVVDCARGRKKETEQLFTTTTM